MALAVNSRFAVLSIDDDDDVKKSSKKKTNPNNSSVQKNESKKKDAKKPSSAKSQASTGNQSTNSKNKTSKSSKKKANADEKQWEQWKQKDEEMVNGNYENELHEAILLSQLDYEKKKDVYAAAAAQAKEQESNNNNNSKREKDKKQRKNKPITMSLSEFNNMLEPTPLQETGGKGDDAAYVVEEADPEFFDRLKEDAKKVLRHEKQVEKRKAREPFVNQEIALARLEEKLERKDKEVASLTEEVTRLKEELKTVRARNRDLCLIMSQGEMKDKAEVLVAMERTVLVKDELSGEVERLHALLEQERSKVRALTQHTEKNKTKGKKRTASENT